MTAHLITLDQIRAAGPCGRNDTTSGFGLLLTNLCQPLLKYDGSIKVSIGDIAYSNGAEDAFWCLRCIPDLDRRLLVRSVTPAVKRAAKHTQDSRVHDCIAALERWLDGDDAVDLAKAVAAAVSAWAARAARSEERAAQAQDLIALFPLHAFADEATTQNGDVK